MKSISAYLIAAMLLVSWMPATARADSASPADVLVESAHVKLTRADYEAWLQVIPAEIRYEYPMSARRVTTLLNDILITKTLAARARAKGLPPDPERPKDTPVDLERALAAAEMKTIERDAGNEFDSKRDKMLVAAREDYIVHSDAYRRPEQVKLSLILISSEKRGDAAALALARETRDKLVSSADFAKLAEELSDDKDSAAHGGSLSWKSAEQLNPALRNVAFALTRVGEISEPVHIGSTYAIVRLDGRRPAKQIPFDELKDQIMDQMRVAYINDRRAMELAAIRNDPGLKVNQPAVDGLVRHVDPKLFRPQGADVSTPTAPAEK
jgi:peptidyl-prolyl cis-trans isomerase C